MVLTPSAFSGGDDLCFYTNISGVENHKRYKMWIENKFRKIIKESAHKLEKNHSWYADLVHDKRTNCLELKGSDDLKELLLEHHQKNRHRLTMPTVTRDLNSCLLIVQGDTVIDSVKRVIIKYPEQKSFKLLDDQNNRIDINVSLVHPEIVSYEVYYKDKKYEFFRGVNNWHEYLQIPYFDEELSLMKNLHQKIRFETGELIQPNKEHIYAKTCR